MAQFTLPSGRVVETYIPTFGQEIHAVSLGLKSPEEFTYAKLAVVVPGLKRAEIAALSRREGRALLNEVVRIWESLEDA